MRRKAQFMCEAQFMTAGQFMRLAAIHVPQGQFTAKPIHALQSAIHAWRLPSHRKRSPLPGKGGSTTSRYRAPLVRGAVCKADRGVVISQSIHAPQGAIHAWRLPSHRKRSPLPGKGGSTASRYRAFLVRGAVCKADRGVVIAQSSHAQQGAIHPPHPPDGTFSSRRGRSRRLLPRRKLSTPLTDAGR